MQSVAMPRLDEDEAVVLGGTDSLSGRCEQRASAALSLGR
jgi:hypothetical protein